jgi:chromatin modification-related protein EAF6
MGFLSVPIIAKRLIMAENVPPGSAAKASITTDSTARGLPYYEKLRRDLRDTIQKKRMLDKSIVCFPVVIKGILCSLGF